MVQMSVGLPNIYTRVRSASESMGRVSAKSDDCCCDLLGAVGFLPKNLCDSFTSLIVRCKKKAAGVKLVHKTNSFAVLTRNGFFCFQAAS